MAIFTNYIFCDGIIFLSTILAIVYLNFQWIFQTWKRKNIPYLEPSFPYGNSQPLHKPIQQAMDIFNIVERGKEKGWKYFGIFLFSKPFFVTLDLEIIKYILVKDFNHFIDRGVYYNEKDDPLSANLFTIGSHKWKKLRTIFTPTFTSGKMKEMFQILMDSTTTFAEYLNGLDLEKPIDSKHVLSCFTTNVIGSCAFGLECNTFKEPNSPFVMYGLEVLKLSTLKIITRSINMAFPRLSRLLGLKTVNTEASKFYFDIVTKTINFREKNNYSRNDFLQLLINIRNEENTGNGKKLTMEEIVSQCFVFFVAGLETSATLMSFTLYELAKHPEIQDRVREELLDVLRECDNNINFNSLRDLEYMQQVVDETLRLYPPVPFITRTCVEDYRIPDSDIILEKGTDVIVPIKNIHHSEEYYDNPLEFNPDNFSPENRNKRHPYAHLAFGEGPRNCIGMRFGLMQTKVGLITILKDFRVKLNPKTKIPLEYDPKSLVVPCVKGGLWMNLEKI